MRLVDHLNLVELAKKESTKVFSRPSFPRQLKKWLRRIFLFLLILAAIVSLAAFGYKRTYANRVYPGVSLGALEVGGMTKGELIKIIQPMVDKIENQGLLFRAESELGQKDVVIKSVLIAISDPDLSRRVMTLDLDATVNKAMTVGRDGSVLHQIQQMLRARTKGYPLSAAFQIDEQEIKNNLQDNLKPIEQEPHDASFALQKNGDFKVIPDQAGYFFDVDGALGQAQQNFSQLIFEPIDLKSVYYEPKVKAADVEQMEPKILDALNLAPIVLKYQDQTWKINKNLLSQWLLLNKNQNDIVELSFNPDEIHLYLQQIS
ncbi:MAG: peptidoglycan binding domain-containing protein, partial [Candidatus Parcubacteria bacterium]|nr:peptidoglycan binding domain-containing protein [Candidatus Parcubacteria bacterium]